MDVNGSTRNGVCVEEFVDVQLSATLAFLVAARDDRSTGNVVAANRAELAAHRAYQEALHLFRVLRRNISQAGMQRLIIRIKEVGDAMGGS